MLHPMPCPSWKSPRLRTLAGAPFPSRLRLLSAARSHAPCRPAGIRGGLCAVALHVLLRLPDSCSYSLQTHSGGASTPKANFNYMEIGAIFLAKINSVANPLWLNGRRRRIPCGLTVRQQHPPSGTADNLQSVRQPVLPRLRLPTGQADVHQRAHDTDKYAVQDELRVNPPSEPDRHSVGREEGRWRNDIHEHSLHAAEEQRQCDSDKDHFHQESTEQHTSPLDRHASPSSDGASQELGQSRSRASPPNNGIREAFHLLKLRTKLQQNQIYPNRLELRHALRHLFRRANQAGPQPAIRHGIILQRNALFKLRPRQPLLVIRVPRCRLLHVGNAPQLVLRLALRLAHDRISRHAEFQRREVVLRAPFPQIRNLLSHAFRRVPMHQICVALLRDQFLRRGRFSARIESWSRLRNWLRLQYIILDSIIFPRKRKMVPGPHPVQHIQPFAGARVPIIMLLEPYAILPRFVRPPRRHHVQRQPPAADVIDIR